MRSKEIHIYLYVLYIYSVIFIMDCVVAQLNGGGGGIGGLGPATKARYKTMYACEDRQLVMDCDFGSKINLIRANFGRFSITQCNEQGQLDMAIDCMSPLTFRIMRERCQDKQKCSVNAASSLFGDKCPKTRKYLEVHFQCQPDPQQALNSSSLAVNSDAIDKVDLRHPNSPTASSQPTIILPHQNSNSNGQTPVLPPNNFNTPQVPRPPPRAAESDQSAQLAPIDWLLEPVMNGEIQTFEGQADAYPGNNEPVFATFRHIHTERVSNPRCVLWDQKLHQWVQRGTKVTNSNATHTTCAFDQAGIYSLVMDLLHPSKNHNQPTQQFQQQQQQQQQQSTHKPISFDDFPPPIGAPQTIPHTQFGAPHPDILVNQPVVLSQEQEPSSPAPDGAASNKNPPRQNQSALVRFFSLFGYLFAFVFIAVALGTIAFIASTMRSSAGAALKSLGNFAAFSSAKYKNGRRSDHSSSGGPLHNKDLLVINNQNGHQFLYAPANPTKINSSASTHILTTGGQAGTLHQFNQHQLGAQQQLYSANGTLSNLSGTGGQTNNYYYGLMGLTPLFQQSQQMQHQLSQHQQANYHQQANKSTVSNETSNSSPSSSGVESGSASVHQHQQQQQACLMMNADYNLMSHHLTNYGQLPLQQPTLTYNAHYGMGAGNNGNNQRQLGPLTGNSMREHIYECVDDDKPYTARLLLPTNLNNLSDQFNSNTLSHHQQQQQQQINQSRALTLSSRLVQNQAGQQQANHNLANNNNNNNINKRLLSHPAIIRDNQAKTNIICSKQVQVTPQRATEISNKFQHDVMAIYNQNDTTTTTANSSTSGNSSSCYSRAESLGGTNGKLSTDC